MSAITDLPPEEQTPISVKNKTTVQVCMINQGSIAAKLFWVNYEGKLEHKKTIKPFERYIFDTHEQHFYCAKTEYNYPFIIKGKWFHQAKEIEEGREILMVLPDHDNLTQFVPSSGQDYSLRDDLSQNFTIFVKGVYSENLFKVKSIASQLKDCYPDMIKDIKFETLFANQWETHLLFLKSQYKGDFINHNSNHIIYLEGSSRKFIGNSDSFEEWAIQNFRFVDKIDKHVYKLQADSSYKSQINDTDGRSYIFLDLSINTVQQRILIELFDDICPLTCKNFRELCQGFVRKDQSRISYVNTDFHRVVKGQYIQGGDIRKLSESSDSNPCSIFENPEFPDESFQLKHNEPGMLGMCKRGGYANTNECQFYITVQPLPFMDRQNVVFGRVIEGMAAIHMIDGQELFNQKPLKKVVIVGAGVYKV